MSDPAIEIRDVAVNAEEIMARVRERVRARRAQAQGLDYDALVDGHVPTIARDVSEVDLAYDLHQLQTGADAVLISLAMHDRRIPVFNSIFYRLENLLHRLVLKYVNQMAGRQIIVNVSAANLITALVQKAEQSQTRAQNLEAQVRALSERVATLEQSRDSG